LKVIKEIGVPRVLFLYTPESISILLSSLRKVLKLKKTEVFLIYDSTSFSLRLNPAGQPSITAPTARECDSPQEVTLNKFPIVFDIIRLSRFFILIAFAAVNRLVLNRLERNCSLLSALRAVYAERFLESFSAGAKATQRGLLPFGTAFGASCGLVFKAFFPVKFLLRRSENKFAVTFLAN